MLIDTHCHIHEADYPLDPEAVIVRAREAGVTQLICVGTSEKSSQDAVKFAESHDDIFAAIGVHPHDTKDGWGKIVALAGSIDAVRDFRTIPSQNGFTPGLTVAPAPGQSRAAGVLLQEGSLNHSIVMSTGGARVTRGGAVPDFADASSGRKSGADRAAGPATSDLHTRRLQATSDDGSGEETGKLVAIGEIGLDYFYSHSPRETQITALEAQIQLALDRDLPIIFHVREAFADFWPIFDNFHGIRGELHSFTDAQANLDAALQRGLLIGVNGISTFTKDAAQQAMFQAIPLEKMLLETDAPFLTPAPFRGRVNEPAFVRQVAEFHANQRGISVEALGRQTSANARALFAL